MKYEDLKKRAVERLDSLPANAFPTSRTDYQRCLEFYMLGYVEGASAAMNSIAADFGALHAEHLTLIEAWKKDHETDEQRTAKN